MLKYFAAQNFKSIRSVEIHMKPFMVLVGPNGAGKTNIVRCLELFGHIINRGTIGPVAEQGYDQLIRREKKPARAGISIRASVSIPDRIVTRSLGLRAPPTKTEAKQDIIAELALTVAGSVNSDEIRIAKEELTLQRGGATFQIEATPTRIEINAGSDQTLIDLYTRAFLGYNPTRPEPQSLDTLRAIFDEMLKDPGDPQLLRVMNWLRAPSPWLRYVRDSLSVTRLRLDASALRRDSTFEDSSPQHLIGPSGEGLAAAVARLRGFADEPSSDFHPVLASLQQVYPRVEDVLPVRIQPGRLILQFKEKGISDELGQANVSDGVLHALALLVALEGGLGGNGLLAIEEPENALHPWSLRAMVQRAQNIKRRQLILTTHSETVVNSIEDPSALFVVESTNEGTSVVPATERESALDSILKESGQKLGNVWMDGTLGGVPSAPIESQEA